MTPPWVIDCAHFTDGGMEQDGEGCTCGSDEPESADHEKHREALQPLIVALETIRG